MHNNSVRAADACNLVYVMWRIEPQSKLVVSVKSNSGQHTSAECSNRGYTNIKPAHATPVPVLREGQSHTLHAVMNGELLRVWADDRLVWEGNLGPAAASMQGPVGIRSDNARLQLQLFAAELPGRPTVTMKHAAADRKSRSDAMTQLSCESLAAELFENR